VSLRVSWRASLLASAFLACTSLTPQDQRRIAELGSEFGEAYRFEANDYYLEVYATGQAVPPVGPIGEEICSRFWSMPNGKSRRIDSELAYMNVYASTGEWLGQFYMKSDGSIAFHHEREHY
jgi:hypothetical protein